MTIAYCFDVTHKTYMETVRQWASQSSLAKDQIAAFFSAGKDKNLQARLDSEVVRVNDFMSRAMNEIEGIRVKYRPTNFYCDLPGVSQAMDFFGKLEQTDKSETASQLRQVRRYRPIRQRRQFRQSQQTQSVHPDPLARLTLPQRPENHHRAADDDHRVEQRGMQMDRQPLDDELGQKRAGKRDRADQQPDRDHLRRQHAGGAEH